MTQVQKTGLDHEPTNGEIFEVLLDFKERFDQIDKRFDGMDQRFDRMDQRFDGMQEFVGEMRVEMEERFTKVDDQFVVLKEHFTDVYHKLDDMRNDIRRVDNKVDMAKDSLYRLEKRSTEDIVAMGTSLIDLRKKVKKLEGVRAE